MNLRFTIYARLGMVKPGLKFLGSGDAFIFWIRRKKVPLDLII